MVEAKRAVAQERFRQKPKTKEVVGNGLLWKKVYLARFFASILLKRPSQVIVLAGEGGRGVLAFPRGRDVEGGSSFLSLVASFVCLVVCGLWFRHRVFLPSLL